MNKQRERATVEAFLRWIGNKDSLLEEWDRERPDALVRFGDELIGVEVTTLREALPRQAIAPQKWSSKAARVVQAAQEAFERQDPTPVVARVELRPGWEPPSRSDMRRIAHELASIARRALAESPPFRRRNEPIQIRDPHPDVRWAYFDRSNSGLGGHWAPSFAGKVLRASAEDIEATIARKEAEVAAYREAARVVWLLIDCDLSGQGVSLDVPEPSFFVNTGFDRVFCCGFGMWEWVEIPVMRDTTEG